MTTPQRWSERWSLWQKSLLYAFSLDVDYTPVNPVLPGDRRVRLNASKAERFSTYHVFGDTLSTGADGSLLEVPYAKVVRGSDWIDFDENGKGKASGSLVLDTNLGKEEQWSIDYRGVVTLPDRAWERPGPVEGTAFITTRHQCSHPRYRRFVEQQLIGFGRIELAQVDGTHRVTLSVDLYSGV